MDNRLKLLRKEKGLTQAEVAKVLNTNQSQYGKYENGKTNLSIENAKKLAEYFEVSVPYLLGIDDSSALSNPELNRSQTLSDYIDFISSQKKFNPVLVKAIKEFIADEEQGLIPYLINQSGAEDSPYHYVWEAWINSDEYKQAIKKK